MLAVLRYGMRYKIYYKEGENTHTQTHTHTLTDISLDDDYLWGWGGGAHCLSCGLFYVLVPRKYITSYKRRTYS